MAKRSSAFFKAVGEQQAAADSEASALQDGETVAPSNFSPVPPLHSTAGQRLHLPTVEPSHSADKQQAGRALRQPVHRTTVTQQSGETVRPSHSNTVTAELHKTSFYLTQVQLDKLDELAYAYKRQTGKRINRNDIVRFLVDHGRLETLLAEW